MTIYFTSDPHFGHRKVADLRGFGDDVAAHDLTVASRWRARVNEADIVWVLGDLAVSSPDYALDVLSTLPGRKRLIAGNHDPIHPMHRRAMKYVSAYHEVFEYVAPFARTKVQGVEVMLSHFPYERDRDETRYAQYRLPDLGLPLIHGHTHGPERLTVTGSRVEVHVGVDAWDLRPVRDDEVAELLRAGMSSG